MFKGSFWSKVLGLIVLLIGCWGSGQPMGAAPGEDGITRQTPRVQNEVWPPLLSLFLPGFDQWWEGEWQEGLIYTGYGLTGLRIAQNAQDELLYVDDDLNSRNDRVRQYILGNQMYLFAGEMSAYQSFRRAANTQKHLGRYTFLKQEEGLKELILAPVEFKFLLRPTTFVPLGLLAGLVISELEGSSTARKYIDGGDIGYTTAFSVQAGVGEEALFRGFMMPVLREQWGSDFWANVGTSLAFSLAHLGNDNQFPIAQALGGYYFGYLTIKNGWSLREAIFVHTWWDILVFTGGYLAQSNAERRVFIPIHLSYF